jgi:hypothetical protein
LITFNNSSQANKKELTPAEVLSKTVMLLQYYPLVLIVTWLPIIVMRMFEYGSVNVGCFWLTATLGLSNLQGLGNAIVFFSVQ